MTPQELADFYTKLAQGGTIEMSKRSIPRVWQISDVSGPNLASSGSDVVYRVVPPVRYLWVNVYDTVLSPYTSAKEAIKSAALGCQEVAVKYQPVDDD